MKKLKNLIINYFYVLRFLLLFYIIIFFLLDILFLFLLKNKPAILSFASLFVITLIFSLMSFSLTGVIIIKEEKDKVLYTLKSLPFTNFQIYSSKILFPILILSLCFFINSGIMFLLYINKLFLITNSVFEFIIYFLSFYFILVFLSVFLSITMFLWKKAFMVIGSVITLFFSSVGLLKIPDDVIKRVLLKVVKINSLNFYIIVFIITGIGSIIFFYFGYYIYDKKIGYEKANH